MLRLIKWLLGYIYFSFENGFSTDFLNACYEKKYNISDVKMKNGKLFVRCPVGLYEPLKATAEENGGELKIIKRKGLYFYIERIKSRYGLFLGFVLGIILISYITGFVWNIEIVGNEKLSDTRIMTFLEENGFCEGVRIKKYDADTLENLLLASFDDIAWAHINRDGTSARVEIGEGVLAPETVSTKKYYNLKAKKDGVIVKAEVYDGWQEVKVGEAVTKGDLLISGVFESERGVNLFTHARGLYLARVKENFSLTVSRRQEYKNYIGTSTLKSLYIFGVKIPLYIGGEVKNSDVYEDTKNIMLGGKKLPLAVVTKTVKEYTVESKELSDSELSDLVNGEIDKKLKEDFGGFEIIKKKLDIKLNSDNAEVKGYVLCNEDIGEEIQIKKSK